LFVIANHFNSKGGDDPLYGRFQPPTLSSQIQRNQQAQVVNDFVDSILALDSNARVIVLGDLNDFYFSAPLTTLKGSVLHALIETLPESERYTYVFEGNSQDLDHILLSDGLFLGVFEYDVVHVNSEFANQVSDHDPQIVRLTLSPSPTPTPTPTFVTISGTISYCTNPVPGPVPNVTLSLSGSASASTLSDASGAYQFASVPSGGTYTVTPSMAARLPGSAGISTVDVVAAQRHFLNLGTPLSGCRLAAGDVNGVGGINTVDVVAIQRFFLGLTTGIANVGRYQFNPATRTYPGVITNQTNQNYDALIFGDVAASYVH